MVFQLAQLRACYIPHPSGDVVEYLHCKSPFMALESCEEGNSGTSRVFLIAAQFLQPLLLQIKAVWQLSLFTFCSTTLFLLVCLKELFISPYFLLFCLDYTLQAFLCWGLVPSLVISVLGSLWLSQLISGLGNWNSLIDF